MPGPSRPLLLALSSAAVLAGAVPTPVAAAERYTTCPDADGLELVQAARVPCAEVASVALTAGAVRAAEAPDVLRRAGWTPLRARTAGKRRVVHDLVALRGRAALRLRRTGEAPDLDGWVAGRELLFSARRIVGGRPIPSDAAVCTSAFLVRLQGGRRGGLSAAHCADLRRDGRVRRRNSAMRRPPAPGIVLGPVRRILTRSRPLDALVLPIPRGSNRSALPVVDRGLSRPPWIVAGPARALPGRRVCFSGRTSGIDRCGQIRGAGLRGAELFLSVRAGLVVRCTTIRARQGDSGGPVFTAPRSDGTVRAVGIVTLIVGSRSRMCFTPLSPSLDALKARLVTG